MMPKFFIRTTTLAIIAALVFVIIPMPAHAASNAEGTVIKEHPFKFYLDPALVPDMGFAQAALTQYVADMNFILAKNTNRRLAFDPATDIILTTTKPHSNQATPPMPVLGFEIWAHAVHTDFPVSYGGYAGIDTSGAGVLAGLKWTKIYDPAQLTPAEVTDYWTQINNMLHELAHVFGAGIGEYYNLSYIQDVTGISPLLNINVFDESDSFWSDKQDFMNDPLLRNPVQDNEAGQTFNRENLLELVQFSDLTATILSNDYRNGVPSMDMSHINIRIISDNGSPIEGAIIKIWSVTGSTSYHADLMVNEVTDANGELTFNWGGQVNPHNSDDFLRLIKIYKTGYNAAAKYVSVFDADIAKLVDGSDVFTITIQLSNKTESSFADVSVNNYAWQYIERLYNANVTGGCSLTPRLFCPDQIVTRAQMAIFLERGMKGGGFTPPAIQSSFADTTEHWAKYWIESLVSDGITSGCGNGNYCPDQYITRSQMAVLLLRAKYGAQYLPNPASGGVFADVPADVWAAAWIEQLSSEGITGGCGNGNYCPDEYVTRAQMSVFIVRAFNLP